MGDQLCNSHIKKYLACFCFCTDLIFPVLPCYYSCLSCQAPGEMSSSDEESLSERSCMSERSFRSERSGGSLSPCAHSTGPKGDTLPWNLSKHERRKRKSQDSVLDPAERAVVRVAGRRFDRKWSLWKLQGVWGHVGKLWFTNYVLLNLYCRYDVKADLGGLFGNCNQLLITNHKAKFIVSNVIP